MRIGVIGGGQLGRMLAIAGAPLGIEVRCFDDPIAGAPAAAVGALVPGDPSSIKELRVFASSVDVVTYEFENFPAELVADVSEVRPVHPSPNALAAAQDRAREKRLFADLGIAITPFRVTSDAAGLGRARDELGGTVIAKARTGGYDGKGQVTLGPADDPVAVNILLAAGDVVVEKQVDFQLEASVIAVRGLDGSVAVYPLTENEHREGILHASLSPARLANPQAISDAHEYVHALLTRLDYVGTLALELFITRDRVLANEMAPRVHNSGHWTIEGAETSQFENHLRALAGLPLGSTAQRGPIVTLNLIGALPDPAALLAIPGAHMHVYCKREARPRRKLGHVTVTAATDDELGERLHAVESVVRNVLR